MSYTVRTLLFTGGLLAAMIALAFVGASTGRRRIAQAQEPKFRGNVVDAMVFSLLGLLLAFSFHGAMGRFDDHRRLIGNEVSAIGTLYQRIDLMPEQAQPALRVLLRAYVQSRIDVYAARVDPASPAAKHSAELRRELWDTFVEACKLEPCAPAATTLVFGAISTVFDSPVNQAVMARMHPPSVVFGMLFGLALLCAFLVGYDHAGLKTRSLLYLLVYPISMAAIIWVILDLEFPRVGVVRVESFDRLLVTLRETM